MARRCGSEERVRSSRRTQKARHVRGHRILRNGPGRDAALGPGDRGREKRADDGYDCRSEAWSHASSPRGYSATGANVSRPGERVNSEEVGAEVGSAPPGRLAQLVERLSYTQEVACSSQAPPIARKAVVERKATAAASPRSRLEGVCGERCGSSSARTCTRACTTGGREGMSNPERQTRGPGLATPTRACTGARVVPRRSEGHSGGPIRPSERRAEVVHHHTLTA
jgi:hypothetical protein